MGDSLSLPGDDFPSIQLLFSYFRYDVPDEGTEFLFPEEAKMKQKEKLPLLYLEAGLHGCK